MNRLANPRSLVSQEDAALVERSVIPRSTFFSRWSHKTTFDQGVLIPFLVDEILPGDHMKYDVTAFVRMGTPTFPVFDNLRVDTHFFFVPWRLVWTNFDKFFGEQTNPGDSVAYNMPYVTSPAGGFAAHSIYDQMGIPVVGQITAGQTINVVSLPLRAYNLIWNEWFRDQNLQNSVTVRLTDSGDVSTDFVLLPRNKMHDYFTTCLPWPQKFASQSVLLTGQAPVTGIGTTSTSFTATSPTITETAGTPAAYAFYQYTATAATVAIKGNQAAGGRPQIYADLSQASATFTINALRQAWLIQSLYERDARFGTRYVEVVRGQYGVESDDLRLMRPEYIGGGMSELVITPIAQTATGGSGLGTVGGAGTAAGQHEATLAAKEHGYVIGIVSVRSELSYQQGLHPMWSRTDRTSIAWPLLSELGEQAVYRQEIYCTGTDAEDSTIFGYQERYQEYRTRWSTVAGMFRSTTASTIHQWHLAQQFSPAPVLGDTFIRDTAPMSRILSAGASTNMQFLADFLINRTATRALPKYGTPATLGRF